MGDKIEGKGEVGEKNINDDIRTCDSIQGISGLIDLEHIQLGYPTAQLEHIGGIL